MTIFLNNFLLKSNLIKRAYASEANKFYNLTLDKWYDYNFYLHSNILLNHHIEYALKDFWLNIVNRIKDNQYLLLHFKVRSENNEIRSISYLLTVNVTDLERVTLIFQEYWNLKNEEYHQFKIDSIILAYKVLVKKGSIGESKLNRHKKVDMVQLKPFKFGGYSLPTTMDITEWSGNVQFSNDFTSAIVYINQSVREYHVSLFNNYQIVKVVVNNETLLEFTDTIDNIYDLDSFTRKIKNQEYIFDNGEMIVKKIERKTNFLSKLKKDPSINNKFITMDLETRNINGILEPYCVSIYLKDQNGLEIVRSYYLKYYSSPDQMLLAALNGLVSQQFNGYIVYLHNFSNFDGIFLLKMLTQISKKIKPIIRDSKIIDLAVSFGYKNSYTIRFRDSYLMLTHSLDQLGKDFNIEYQKGIFPYKFVDNPDIKLNYNGKFPDISYFEDISKEQYENYCSRDYKWNLEYETKLYCELDCKVLYLVIEKFANLIFELLKVDIAKYPTLPSIAMAIYRSNFLTDDYKIPLIDGIIYNELKKGYTGGMVDVYKPTNDDNNKVFSYDVNSLYPFSMSNYPMPVGNPIYFEGDIFRVNPNAFGIFEVEIITHNHLKYPILQTKVKINNTTTTIAPLGNWKGWYFSGELVDAINAGYSVTVIRGYLFEKGYIFKDYVDFIYKLKANSIKGSPLYLIAKLLLNSLYGKLGIDPDYDKHVIIDSKKSPEYHNKYIVTNVINLGDKELISYFDNNNKNDIKLTNKNSSLPIAIAITAYARKHMIQLKQAILALGLIIYYMDTDCVAISGKLDPKYVGVELGKLKLEHVFDKVVYLAPKVYGGINNEYEYTKVKGLKNQIAFSDLIPLLKKDQFTTFNQKKQFKHIDKGHIEVRNEIYTLMITENKRKLIFNENNIFVNTEPFYLVNGVIDK